MGHDTSFVQTWILLPEHVASLGEICSVGLENKSLQTDGQTKMPNKTHMTIQLRCAWLWRASSGAHYQNHEIRGPWQPH